MGKFIEFDRSIININFIQKIGAYEDNEYYVYISGIDDDIDHSLLFEIYETKAKRDERFEELKNILCGV